MKKLSKSDRTKREAANARRRARAAAKRDETSKVVKITKPKLVVDNTKFGNVRTPRRKKLVDAPSRAGLYQLPEVPPGVGPSRQSARIAMDSEIQGYNNWAASQYGMSFSEGTTFLGYPYLAELAQRSEYRQIVETVAEECTRKWITLSSSSEDENKDERIKKLNDAIDAFKLRAVAYRTLCVDGYFGRAHVYIDTGDRDKPDELKMPLGNGRDKLSRAKMKPGKLRGFKVVEPVWTYPQDYNSNDPLSDEWYNPQTWFVMSRQIHASRFLRVVSREVPDMLKPAYSFGGMSMTQVAKPYIENWLRTRQSISDIIHSFSTSGIKTNLASLLTGDGEQLFKRAELYNNTRDNSGLMLLDKDTEEFFNVSTPLAGLDNLQSQSQEQMCSVSRIPVVKLLGIQPSGLNASSQGELDSFGDHIHAYQERVLRPLLTVLIDFIQLTIWGEVDQSITFIFEPLTEMTEKEKAEIQKMKAEVDDLHINAQVISPEEARGRIALDPDSGYQGLNPNEMPEPLDVDDDGEQDMLGGGALNPGSPRDSVDGDPDEQEGTE